MKMAFSYLLAVEFSCSADLSIKKLYNIGAGARVIEVLLYLVLCNTIRVYLILFCIALYFPLRKHAYSNILKIIPPKNENFQMKHSDIFHISAQNID